jgi:hypothetical protein
MSLPSAPELIGIKQVQVHVSTESVSGVSGGNAQFSGIGHHSQPVREASVSTQEEVSDGTYTVRFYEQD